jgi:hypothetical protein
VAALEVEGAACAAEPEAKVRAKAAAIAAIFRLRVFSEDI